VTAAPPLAVVPPEEGAPPVPAAGSVPLHPAIHTHVPTLINEPNRAVYFIAPNFLPSAAVPEMDGFVLSHPEQMASEPILRWAAPFVTFPHMRANPFSRVTNLHVQ
jgi:hypothetical protein